MITYGPIWYGWPIQRIWLAEDFIKSALIWTSICLICLKFKADFELILETRKWLQELDTLLSTLGLDLKTATVARFRVILDLKISY